MPQRCWEEARVLGRELANGSSRHLADKLRQLDRYFELGRAPEEEAIHMLLRGLVSALGDDDDDDGDDDA